MTTQRKNHLENYFLFFVDFGISNGDSRDWCSCSRDWCSFRLNHCYQLIDNNREWIVLFQWSLFTKLPPMQPSLSSLICKNLYSILGKDFLTKNKNWHLQWLSLFSVFKMGSHWKKCEIKVRQGRRMKNYFCKSLVFLAPLGALAGLDF